MHMLNIVLLIQNSQSDDIAYGAKDLNLYL